MRTRKLHLRLLALLAVFALVASACGSDDDSNEGDGDTTTTAAAEGKDGGTLVWTHEQEPPDLHLDDPNNNLTITAWVRQGLLDGLFGISGDTQFFPELVSESSEPTETADGVTVDFTLRDGLTWSDGEPLTANDVKWTWEVIMAKGDKDEDEDGEKDYIYLLGDRTGYDTVTDFTVTSDTEFSMTWESFFAGYKAILPEIFPMHSFSEDPAKGAAELNAAFPEWKTADGTVIPSSGPLLFDSWTKGEKMVLTRNDSYHGSNSPDAENTGVAHIDAVEIRFVADTDQQVNALKSGEAQVIMTQPQLAFEELAKDDNFVVASLAGPVFEHLGFNINNKHLAKPEVREALALALDKNQIMEGLYNKLFGDLLPADGLGNTYWMSNQPQYEDHQGEAGYGKGDVDAAKAKLEEAGYAEGSDGVFEHPEDGKLTLRIGTTSGNALRELQEQLIQQNLKDAGIEIEIDNGDAADYFGSRPFSDGSLECSSSGGEKGNCDIWDITMFAWVGGPWPGSQTAAYRSGSGNNPYGYSNEDFDAKADECDATLDDTERDACYNELDVYVTTLEVDAEDGLFMLPLTQKPSFYAYSNDLASGAVSPDANSAGPLVNVVDYQFKA